MLDSSDRRTTAKFISTSALDFGMRASCTGARTHSRNHPGHNPSIPHRERQGSSHFGNFPIHSHSHYFAGCSMKVVGRSRLDAFLKRHADARRWIECWLTDAEAVTWCTPHDIRAQYSSASFIHPNIVIFNVKGNSYRLETTVAYKSQTIVVNWIGTHAEYNQRNRKR